MKQRVMTAMVLLGVLAVVVWQIFTPLFIIVIAFLSAVAAHEIMHCAKVDNRFIRIVGAVFAFGVPFFCSASILEPWISTDTWFSVIHAIPKNYYVIVLAIAFFLAMLKGYQHTKFEQVAVSLVACVFVPYAFSMFGMLRDITGFGRQLGVYLLFYALIAALATDVGAQLGGMAIGKTKMSPHISPKKTMEGAACGIAFSMILQAVALLLYNHFAYVGLTRQQMNVLLIAAPFVSLLSMMGDLTASVLKRNFDVKDFGKIFPGHGGVMDRFDSTLFALPLTYCLSFFLV